MNSYKPNVLSTSRASTSCASFFATCCPLVSGVTIGTCIGSFFERKFEQKWSLFFLSCLLATIIALSVKYCCDKAMDRSPGPMPDYNTFGI
jgi:hypothetical protein